MLKIIHKSLFDDISLYMVFSVCTYKKILLHRDLLIIQAYTFIETLRALRDIKNVQRSLMSFHACANKTQVCSAIKSHDVNGLEVTADQYFLIIF